MRNELSILQNTDHPHITRVFEILEDKRNFFVVMEFLSCGDLYSSILKVKVFSEDHAVMITN